MRSFTVGALAFCAVLILSACGGGSGSAPRMAPDVGGMPMPPHTPPIPDPRVPVDMNNDDFGYSTATIQAAMQTYVRQHSNARWSPMVQPPVIRPAVGTSADILGALVLAVDAMNAWLPYDQHIRIGDPVARFMHDPRLVATGEILLGETVATPDLDPLTLGYARSDYTADGQSLRAGTISLLPSLRSKPFQERFYTVMHEMLHTMGLYGHLDPQAFPDSLMGHTITDKNYLPVFDGLTLLMGYTQLRPGSSAPAIDAANLGPWAENTPTLAGRIKACDCFFVADLIGGHAVSWFTGDPQGIAVQNLGPTGTASWVGKMVGWTTAQEAVWSDMNLDVNLASFNGTSLDGQVEFDNISLYESGTQWGDGELAYDIDVLDVYFRSGRHNPDGYVFGLFSGPALEGAVGTLEHPGLTGAFGGTR